jgi:hypothetical protein
VYKNIWKYPYEQLIGKENENISYVILVSGVNLQPYLMFVCVLIHVAISAVTADEMVCSMVAYSAGKPVSDSAPQNFRHLHLACNVTFESDCCRFPVFVHSCHFITIVSV